MGGPGDEVGGGDVVITASVLEEGRSAWAWLENNYHAFLSGAVVGWPEVARVSPHVGTRRLGSVQWFVKIYDLKLGNHEVGGDYKGYMC